MPKFALRFALIVAAVLIAAALLNPTPEQHRAQIKAAAAERSPLANLLGLGALTAFVSNYHSLGVASYTVMNDRWITVGAFGVVYVLPPPR